MSDANSSICNFSPKFKVLEVTSKMTKDDDKLWIHSKLLTSQVKGK